MNKWLSSATLDDFLVQPKATSPRQRAFFFGLLLRMAGHTGAQAG
jgi:hypothetical protein